MKKLTIELPDDETKWAEWLEYITNQIREGYLAGDSWDISQEYRKKEAKTNKKI